MLRDLWIWLRLQHRLSTRAKRVAEAEAAFDRAVAKLGPGDIAIDCGANIGVISQRLAETGAELHAFEPDPDAFAALSAKLAVHPKAMLHNAAIGTEEGEAALFASTRRVKGDARHSVSSSLLNESSRVSDERFDTVRVIDFIAFLNSLPKPPKLIKMDVEGAEVAVLERLLDADLAASIGAIFVETHEKQLPSLRARTFALIDRFKPYPHVYLDWG